MSLALWGFSQAVSGVAFVNPPDGATQQAQDYSSNAAHAIGSSLHIQWSLLSTEESKPLDIVMWEDVANTAPEYIARMSLPPLSLQNAVLTTHLQKI